MSEQIEYVFDPSLIDVPEGYEAKPKLDKEGNQLFLLPQEDKEEIYEEVKVVKTTEPTNNPVMVNVQIPMLDDNGVQRSYEQQQPIYEQIPVLDEELNETGEFVNGEIIGYEGTGVFIPMWTSEERQEEDSEGNLLYWGEEIEDLVQYVPQPDLLITMDHPEWNEGLLPAYELVELPPEPSIPPPPSIESVVDGQGKKIEQIDEKNTINEFMIYDSMDAIAQVYEEKEMQLAEKEQEILDAMEAIAEVYEQLIIMMEG